VAHLAPNWETRHCGGAAWLRSPVLSESAPGAFSAAVWAFFAHLAAEKHEAPRRALRRCGALGQLLAGQSRTLVKKGGAVKREETFRHLSLAGGEGAVGASDLRCGPSLGGIMPSGCENVRMDVVFRPAIRADLPKIVEMLANDFLGATREHFADPLPEAYVAAFDAIGGVVVATMQLTFIPNLTYIGGQRALIEGVRVDDTVQNLGVGGAMIRWGIEQARRRKCRLVELTTNKQRVDAQRFYDRLGFVDSHIGMKFEL
jgi:GNAT superfamily N-acetyltransferase